MCKHQQKLSISIKSDTAVIFKQLPNANIKFQYYKTKKIDNIYYKDKF